MIAARSRPLELPLSKAYGAATDDDIATVLRPVERGEPQAVFNAPRAVVPSDKPAVNFDVFGWRARGRALDEAGQQQAGAQAQGRTATGAGVHVVSGAG